MRLRAGAWLAVLALGLGPASAARADTDINFESPALANCTGVTTQYSGLNFLLTSPEGDEIHRPAVAVINAAARSPSRALVVGDCSAEFDAPQLSFRLSQTRAGVSVWVRAPDMGYNIPVQLRAYDAGDVRIDQNGTTFTTLTAGSATWTQISAATDDNTNRIATVVLKVQNVVLAQGYHVQLDDLHLTDGAGGAPPDFSLGPAPRLTVGQGAGDIFDVPINRLNGSTGNNISFAASGLPEGVTVDGPYVSPDSVNMRILAARNAPPGSYSFTLTGTPNDPAIGSTARSLSIPVTITERHPSVEITAPAEGTLLDRVPFEYLFTGGWSSLRGVDGPSNLCTVVTHSPEQPPFPADCELVTGQSGVFSEDIGPLLTPGANHLWVFIRDNSGRTAVATRLLQIADETTGIDLRITGIEVTQGSQYAYSAGFAIPQGTPDNTTRYRGVQLVANRTLYVRVFANTNRPARSDGTTPTVTARLRVFRNGVEIPFGPLMPLPAARNLDVGGLYASNRDRGTFDTGYLFTIPLQLTASGPMTVEAEINEGTRPIIECATCRDNNRMRVTDMRFRPVRTREIFPIRFTDTLDGGHRASASSQAPFLLTRRSLPFPLSVHPYVATVDITSELMQAQRDGKRAESYVIHHPGDYERDHNPPGAAIGVANGGFAGLTRIAPFCCDPLRIDEFAVVTETRPLTSVAHEYGHVERLEHADHACGGDSDGQTADDAWPDPRGVIGGFVFNYAGRMAAPPWIPPIQAWYDYMSYCANINDDSDSWLSPRNWDRLVDKEATGGAARASRSSGRASAVTPASGPGLAITAVSNLDGSGGVVTSVQPTDGNAQGSDPAGDAQIIVVGPNGSPVTTNVTTSVSHVNAPGTPAQRVYTAVVPAGTDPRSVQIAFNGQPVASRDASANAPKVTLLAPRARAKVKRSLTLRWRGSDADGDELTYAVDQATGPRAKFRMVAAGLRGNRVTLPLAMLQPAKRARFRVRALDGFRQGNAVVANINVPPAPPQVTIIEPSRTDRVAADSIVSLSGEAFAGGGRRLTGRALTWRVDGKKVATGEHGTLATPKAGTRRITLTAVSGRQRGVATFRLRVSKVTPRLLTKTGPAKLGRRARTVTLRLAASVPSTARMTAGARAANAKLTRRARGLKLRVKPGAQPLTVRLRLRGGGRTATETLVIPRS